MNRLYPLAERWLFPYIKRRLVELQENQIDFIHYSSDQTVYKILEKEKIWLRNISFMNDYAEMSLGRMILLNMFREYGGLERLNDVLQGLGITKLSAEEVIREFENYSMDLPRNVYISSLSEHRAKGEEREMGRLSMWRAYGHGTGAALVLSRDFAYASMPRGTFLYVSPILYVDPSNPENLMQEMRKAYDKLSSFPHLGDEYAEEMKELLIKLLCVNMVSIKHIGFQDEREWRIVLIADSSTSRSIKRDGILEKDVVFVSGVMQKVYKIHLGHLIQSNFGKGNTLQRLVKGIIIGPTMNADMSYEVFTELLEEKGFWGDMDDYVKTSNIPLRI